MTIINTTGSFVEAVKEAARYRELSKMNNFKTMKTETGYSVCFEGNKEDLKDLIYLGIAN